MELANRVGEARTLLLEARFAAAADRAAAIKQRVIELQQQLPALNQCRLVRKILDRWERRGPAATAPPMKAAMFSGACSGLVRAACRGQMIITILMRRNLSCSFSHAAEMKAL